LHNIRNPLEGMVLMFSLKLKVASFVMFTVLAPVVLKAEEPIKANTVHVTATRVERELMDVPMSVSVVTKDDIRKNPSTSIADLVKDIPGLTIHSATPGINRIEIRGEDSLRTLILIDGQKVSEHKSMSGTPILIDPANIERIEVIKGPASVLYGSDAIGGVVNIITKKNINKPITGSLSTGYFGATEGFSQSTSLAGSINGWNYNLSASNANYGDTKTPYGDLPDTDYDQQDFRGMLSYDFNEHFSTGISASYFDSNTQMSALEVENEHYVPFGTVEVPEWKMKKVGIFGEAKNINDYFARLRVDVWYQNVFKDFANDFKIPVGVIMGAPRFVIQQGTAKNTLDTIGTSLQSDWLLGDNNYLIAGYDFSVDSLDSDNYNYTKPPLPMIPAIEYNSYFKGSQTSHAGYLAMESTLPANFTLSYGVRYTMVESEMTRAEKIQKNTSSSAGALGSETDSSPVFSVGLVWSGIDNLALRVHWAQGFRVPTLDNKYISTTKADTTILANPDLTPETSDNFEIGARYMNGGFTADIATFYSLADDYLTLVHLRDVGGIEEMRYENQASAKTYGVETAFSYAFANGLKPYVSATFLRRQFDNNTSETYDTFTPLSRGRVGIAYDASFWADKIGFNTDFYLSGQSESHGYEGNDRIRYEGFTTLNFAIGMAFGKNKEWNIQAEVLNLLDKEYRFNGDSDSALESGIHGNLRLSYIF